MQEFSRRQFISKAGRSLVTAGALVSGAASHVQAMVSRCRTTARPNLVFILIDDLGARDVTCYGSEYYETPNIDRLAAEGMKFTNAYAACPVCSPTRASILTGRYPASLNLTDWIPGHKRPNAKLLVPSFNQQLPPAERTFAEALKPLGYASASIGKWHLGDEPFYPETQGFDINIAGTKKGQPPSYFYPYNISTLDGGNQGEYLTDRLTHEAEAFIETNRGGPFCLYLSHFAVHTPIQARDELTAKYQAKPTDGGQTNARYAAMIHSVDTGVGRIMDKLDALGIADNTAVFFMSDNGGLARVTSNAPLRAGKGTMYEGGIREPMIIRWSGKVRPGSVCDEVVTSTDFYPTMLEMAGLSVAPDNPVDGVSLVPLLTETGTLDREAVYWHYPHYHPGGATPCGAVRKGAYKLIEYFEDWSIELFNLEEDTGEQHDLSTQQPQKAAEMLAMLHDWRDSVNAQMPTPNPNYNG